LDDQIKPIISNQTYDNIRLVSELMVPLFAFISAVLTAIGCKDAAVVTAILGALDVLTSSIVIVLRKHYGFKGGDQNGTDSSR
jgi:hypothetical protein